MKWKELFTHVFLINLPEMRERLLKSDKMLYDAGIEYTLWNATKDENGIKGLLLSMKSLFTHILTTDIQNFIVLEDDCNFLLPINDFLNLLVEQLPKNYDMLLLGCTLMGIPTRHSDNLLKIDASYCTQAIGYSRQVVERILPLLDHVEPYDIKLMKNIQTQGRCYCTFPMMCEQWPGYSSIEKKEMDWPSYQRITYASYTKGI